MFKLWDVKMSFKTWNENEIIMLFFIFLKTGKFFVLTKTNRALGTFEDISRL